MPKTPCRIYLTRLLTALIMLPAVCIVATAQESSQYDRGTPPQHAAGVSSLGSYTSTDLGTVNLSNGALNFKLPLGQVGGRGFWLPLTLNYSSKLWSARRGQEYVTDPTPPGHLEPVCWAVYDDTASPVDAYDKLVAGWTVGAEPFLKARGVGIGPHQNTVTGGTDYNYVVVKLTLVLPDKGEIQLRDDQTDGVPLGAQVDTVPGYGFRDQDGYRGRRWHATDGSGLIFLNDSDNGVVNGNLSGTVITSDGTRYHFTMISSTAAPSVYLNLIARCDSVIDRNGNLIQISYPPSGTEVDYTDQLGRVTRLQQNVPDPTNPNVTLALLVTLPGYNGQPRYYKVKTDVMNLHYRTGINPINPVLPVINGDGDPLGYGYGWSGPHTSLFPDSYGRSAEQIDNLPVVTELDLPDGRSLRFAYNAFGEVAEVQLPTGGKIQYDYAYQAGLPTGNSHHLEVHPTSNQATSNVTQIDRAVVAKRTYPDGSTLEGSWSYSYSAQTDASLVTTQGTTEVSVTSAAGALSDQWHFFLTGQRYLESINGNLDGTGYTLWSTGLERRSEMRDVGGLPLTATEQDWTQRTSVVWFWSGGQQQPENDNRVNETRHYLDTGSFAKTDTFYDNLNNRTANNVTEMQEYDYDGTLKRRTVISYFTNSTYSSDGVHLLRLPQQISVYEGASNERARTIYEYDNYTADTYHAGLEDYFSVAPSITGHDASYGSGYLTRGNQTRVQKWLKAINGNPERYLDTYPRYDSLGNVISIKDPRGNVTTFDFTDDFGAGSNPGGGLGGSYGLTYALPTLVTSPPPNPGEPPHTARSQYDFSTGLLTGFKDRNNIVTQTSYNDPFDRPTLINTALGTAVETHTAIYYAGLSPATVSGVTLTNNDVLTATDLNAAGDANLRTWTHTDGFGRTIESWSRDPQGNAKVVTVYDALGRVCQKSNPYRPSLNQSPDYTTTAYDLAGRVVSVTTPDFAAVSTAYYGAQVLVTDQAGKQRLSQTDALGRLIKVWEITPPDGATVNVSFGSPPQQLTGYLTTYDYDALDNLITVTQAAQTRGFVYDSLKRLRTATNPESGTTSYDYDENGNLWHKIDARSVTTTFTYDALNRLTLKNYNDATPAVNYYYDTQALPAGAPAIAQGAAIGRLVAVTYGGTSAGAYYYSYDARGRALQSLQRTEGQDYILSYQYNLAGGMKSETYPSGRVVMTAYDPVGRVSGVSGHTAAGDKTYASAFSYTAHGAVSQMNLGNGLWEHTSYNSRLQAVEIGLGTGATAAASNLLLLGYAYGSTDNNGNLQSQTITTGMGTSNQVTLTQSYSYDGLNRLQTASESGAGSGWSQSYGYDRYGNRAVTSGYVPNSALTPQSLSAFDARTNRLLGSGYDAAGNQTVDAVGRGFSYDAENRLVGFNDGLGTTASYSYDGEGRRVKKVSGGTTTLVYVYNAAGQLIAEYTSPDGGAIGGLKYVTADYLGSGRVVSGGNGGLVRMRYDYLPFGEVIGGNIGGRGTVNGYSGADTLRQKFGAKEWDNETGLDFFEARYYSAVQGRFTSVDPENEQAKRTPGDPQSWNAYSYVNNNPLARTDPDGKGFWDRVKNWWSYGIYAENDFVNEKLRERLKKIDGIESRYDVKLDKLSGQQVRELFDRAKADYDRGAFQVIRKREATTPYLLTMGVIVVGRYGFDGSRDVRRAVDEVAQPGTHETVNGRVPTREEAEQLIYRAGGRIERVERAHPPERGHDFDHINYTTAEGQKATVRVESVGRQFYRDPARKSN